ncbi:MULTISPECIES: WG repeat-containing protein [unclassified Micromonospora]|uniref:WG repeat-containing protein n=1 Tax=unclassified Micromonospora TaxID=2617518 RepID=UPI0020B42F22|nr:MULTISPECIES: WG repeat-containing protein [unclassified Micromonospora]MDM4781890.1 WG repeat-containing protein [Micromonospora sp. b486]
MGTPIIPAVERTTAEAGTPAAEPDRSAADPEPQFAVAATPGLPGPGREHAPGHVASSGTADVRQDSAAPQATADQTAPETTAEHTAPQTTADHTAPETTAEHTAEEPTAIDGTIGADRTGSAPPAPQQVGTAADAAPAQPSPTADGIAVPGSAPAEHVSAPTGTEGTGTTPAEQPLAGIPSTGTGHSDTLGDGPERADDLEHATPAQPGQAPARTGDGGPAPTGTDDAREPRTPDAGTGDDAGPAAGAEPQPPVDPEQALAEVGWELDPRTLRERAPDPARLRVIRDGLTGKLDTTLDNRSRARLLSLRSVASRILGDLDDALGDARLAVTYAEATGEFRRTALARARLAEALRWRGDHAEADRLFAEANSPELPDRLRALLHEHAGRCCYDQGRLTEACLHFERALDLRHGEDAQLDARIGMALDAVAERAAADGFGPPPRRAEEVLGTPRLPVATFDEEQQLWGYANADGEMVVAHRYAEAQPFHEGLAWVRRPEASRWALIDTSGAALIEANNGYRSVVPFSEGLSWVSMDGKGRWMAVDRMNIVKIPPGYEEARPFRNGLAAVRQNGGWGAVDLTGEVVVPTRYHRLGTPLADGREVDGFTADGLAVVELAGRRGVVDRAGRVVVTPAYPTVVVHPVAFLVATESGRWGALDRRGEPLIDPVHPGRTAVVAEIDRLLADASPVL